MAAKKEVPGKQIPSGRTAAPEPQAPEPLKPEEREALRARVVHMFQPHAQDPLMRRLEQTVMQLIEEGRVRG